MIDPLDEYPTLIDDAALDEIELTSRLMIAASNSKQKLRQCEIDDLLGLGSTA